MVAPTFLDCKFVYSVSINIHFLNGCDFHDRFLFFYRQVIDILYIIERLGKYNQTTC